MPLYLPEKCLRDRKDCSPMSQIEADDTSSFVCCGFLERSNRTIRRDMFRLCWKNHHVDEMGDYDAQDLLDQASVINDALSTFGHDQQCPKDERRWRK